MWLLIKTHPLLAAQETYLSQNILGQTRLSSENLGKLTSDITVLTPELKPGKSVRGSVMLPKGKVDSHGSGSQKQHHSHQSDTPQVPVGALEQEARRCSSFPQHPTAHGQHP